MTLTDIKSTLGLTQLDLNLSTDADDNPTDWYRHWDNEKRVAVSIHKELVAELQADGNISSLALQTEPRVSNTSKEKYTAHRIVKYKDAEVVL